MGVGQPSGTVTFLFTDVEGSTRLWEDDPGGMRRALERHDAIVRSAADRWGGYVFSTAGDGFGVAFDSPAAGCQAAIEVQRALATATTSGDVCLRARMGLHTGTAFERDGNYFGPALNRAARMMSAGHGGQVLVSQATFDLVDLEAIDLGVHRLRDVSSPEHIWQIADADLARDFPQLRTLTRARHNLPPDRTSFLGRASEVEALQQLVSRRRLVTLVGPPGVGKTRLAVRVAAGQVERFENGVWLIELARLEDRGLVGGAVIDALGLRREHRAEELAIADQLVDDSRLLVFDNCEHVLEEAARLVDRLLGGCPRLTILATSREPLGVDGERVLRVEPLMVSAGGPAVELFRDRAADLVQLHGDREEAVLVQELCDRLDGLPLAIELAAAQLGKMSISDLVNHLQRPSDLLVASRAAGGGHHWSLAAAIEWSWAHLLPAEQLIFDSVAVLPGGFGTIEAAAVSGRDPDPVRDLLGVLASKSLVRRVDDGVHLTRFDMLKTVRDLGVEHLRQRNELEDVEGRLISWALDVVRAAEPHLVQGDSDWLELLDANIDNLRAALGAAERHQDQSAVGLEIAGRLGRYWFLRTLYREGCEWLTRLIARAGEEPEEHLARALYAYGFLAGELGEEVDDALRALERSVELYRRIGDESGLAWALNNRARVGFTDAHQSRADLDESTDLARRNKQPGCLFMNLMVDACWQLTYGDPVSVLAIVGEALPMARRQRSTGPSPHPRSASMGQPRNGQRRSGWRTTPRSARTSSPRPKHRLQLPRARNDGVVPRSHRPPTRRTNHPRCRSTLPTRGPRTRCPLRGIRRDLPQPLQRRTRRRWPVGGVAVEHHRRA